MENNFSTQALIKRGSEVSGGANAAVWARWCMILATGLGVGYVAWKYILPALVDMVWDIAQICVIGIPTLLVLGFLFANRRNIVNFYDIIADKIFGKLVQMAPFRMQEKKIEHAQNSCKVVEDKFGVLKGAFVKVTQEYSTQDKNYKEAVKMEEIAAKAGDEDAVLRAQRAQGRAAGFISILKEQYENMQELVEVVQLGLKRLKEMIEDAKIELQESKTVFDVTMAGADAMTHMQAAMQGDAQLNSEAEKATAAVLRRIALAVGQTQAAMEIVSDITKTSNLKDAAKLAVARDQLKMLGTSDITAIPVRQSQFHYQGMAKKMDSKYPID